MKVKTHFNKVTIKIHCLILIVWLLAQMEIPNKYNILLMKFEIQKKSNL